MVLQSRLLLFLLLTNAPQLFADSLVLESHPALPVLSKSTTLVIRPPELTEADFVVRWKDPAIEGIQATLVPGSLQWVRGEETLVLPRARLHLEAKNVQSGTVEHHGAVQVLEINGHLGIAEIPVVLMTDEASQVRLHLTRPDGKEQIATLQIEMQSPLSADKRVHVDASCSSYRLNVETNSLQPNSWMFLGCRLVYSQNAENMVPSLELYVYWDGIGQTASIDGVRTPSHRPAVWQLRLRSAPGRVRLESIPQKGEKPQGVTLSYRVRPEIHLGSLGLGVGPYTYQYTEAGTQTVDTIGAVVTLYGSVFFNHYMRSVLFSVSPLSQRKIFNDTGLYLLIEQARILDNRLSVNILLGGHSLVFPYGNRTIAHFSFPQGFEFVFRDVMRRSNATIGLFAYPFAGQRSYYNVWARLSFGRYFGELNYIQWNEAVDGGAAIVGAQLWGVSLGMPIAEFL